MLLRLALRSLGRARRRTALTLGAITLGSAIVVFAWGFGEGLVSWLTRVAVSGRTGAVQVHALGHLDAAESSPLKLDLERPDVLSAELHEVPGVKAVTQRIRFMAIATTGAVSSMVLVDAIDPVTELQVCPDRFGTMSAGAKLQPDGPRAIVVGAELASSLSVGVGDTLTLAASTRDGAQNALDYTIVGVTLGSGLLESKRVAITRLQDAQELLAMRGRATELALAAADLDELPALTARLSQVAGPTREVSAWTELNPFLRDSVGRVRIVLRGVSLVLFAVVVMGVANTMLMAIFERVREIGTLLAIGMRRRRVLRLFLLEAAILSGVGAIAGVALGAAIVAGLAARGIDFTPPGSKVHNVIVPVLSPAVLLTVAIAAVLGAVLAAWLPARRASRLDPVEALRND